MEMVTSIFSSPELNMLNGSLKDHAVSVVHLAASTILLIKNLLLLSCLANLNQAWQEFSLEGPL